MSEISIARVDDRNALLADWQALSSRAPGASFFLSPAWMKAWLGGGPRGARLWRVAGLHDGATVLLGVVGEPPGRRPPVIGMHAAHLHEFGAADHDAVYIEYNDFLVAEDAPSGIRKEAVEAMCASFARADDLVFRNAAPPLAEAIGLAVHNRRRREITTQPTFQISIDAESDVLERVSASLRRQVRRSIRLYESRGALALEVASGGDARARAWQALVALHEDGWRRRGKPGVFANPALAAFHERLKSDAQDATELAVVRCGEEVIACLYNFIHNGCAMNYQSGFRFENDNRLKPGMVAHALMAEHYRARGFKQYDLLAGDASYKRRLGRKGPPLVTLALERRRGVRALLRNLRRRVQGAGMHQT